MDFDPIPDLEVNGYRLAPITMIEPGPNPSGDAYLVAPDGAVTDLHWKAERRVASSTVAPATMPESNGVITVEVTVEFRRDADLRAVLDAAVRVVKQRRNPATDIPERT